MAEKRETVNFRMHNIRLIRVRDIWVAPDKYNGQTIPVENRRFKLQAIVPKTAASQSYAGAGGRAWAWLAEPAFKPFVDAIQKVYSLYMNGQPLEYLKSIVRDGDVPNEKGIVPDHMRGHWTFTASCGTAYPPSIEGVVDGQAVPAPAQVMGGRKLWDDGDFASADFSVTKSGQKATEFVVYFNSVLFLRPGDRITFGTSRASGEEMLREAAAAGHVVTGLNGGALPGQVPQGFGAPAPQPSLTPFGGAPQVASAAPSGIPGTAPTDNVPPFGGSFTKPPF